MSFAFVGLVTPDTPINKCTSVGLVTSVITAATLLGVMTPHLGLAVLEQYERVVLC